MGFFSKSTSQRKVVRQPNGGKVLGGSPSDLGNGRAFGTEEIRANLANLFTEDGDADDPTATAYSEPQRQYHVQQLGEPRLSGPLKRETSRLKSPRSSMPLPKSRSKSLLPKINTESTSATSVRPLMSLSTLEHMGTATEVVTPLSQMAPTLFPDAGKSGTSRSQNNFGGGPSDSAKWSLQSPKRSPRQRSFMVTSPASQSPNNRKQVINRSNSIQRIARRASSFARKPSMKLSSDISQDQEATQLKPPKTPTRSDSDTFPRSQLAPAPFSDSPTTPQIDAIQIDPARKNAAKPLAPKFSSDLMDDLDSQSLDLPVIVAGISRENPSAEPCVHETVTTLPIDTESGIRSEGGGLPGDADVLNLDAALSGAPGLSMKSDACSETEDNQEDDTHSSALRTENWGSLDAADFTETYGLDVATAKDFPTGPPSNENSDGGLGQAQACDLDFSPHGDSSEKIEDLLAPSQPLLLDAEVPAGEDSKREAGFGALPKPKPKGKARKRPPPLLAPEPPSGNSTPSSTSSSTVFASNGDFTTGGFRITAEGMVGKPDRVTRRDSDDAPSMVLAPSTSQELVFVRGLQEFRKGPTLGMGAAGRVYLAIHEPSGKSMAIKVVNVYDEAKRNQLLKELDTLSSHVSRFLVRFYGAFYDGKGAVHIALEFMDGGCLDSTVAKFGAIPEPVTKMIAADCLRALRFLHRHNVLHRDFKTANILLSKRGLCAKVSDFGLARDMDANVSRIDTFVGTIAYMSPERLHGGKYTYASDIWALGISIVECILGRYPFDKPQSYFDYLDVQATDMLKGVRGASRELKDFVQLCTDADPRRRPTAAQLMLHPWLANLKRDPEMFRLWMDTLVQRRTDAASTKSVHSIRSFLTDAR